MRGVMARSIGKLVRLLASLGWVATTTSFFAQSIGKLIRLLTGEGRATAPKFARTGSQPAHRVSVNARIFTSNTNQLYADSLAIKGERLAYVGSRQGVADYVGPDTEVIDGRGRLVTPGFVDNHCHALWIGGMSISSRRSYLPWRPRAISWPG